MVAYGDPAEVIFVDVDRDGSPDAVLTTPANNPSPSYTRWLRVYRGHGDGIFDLDPTKYDSFGSVLGLCSADFNSDGWPDLAVTGGLEDAAAVYLNAGDGTFLPYSQHPVGDGPASLEAADLNADGRPDLVVFNGGSRDLSILLNDGAGGFGPEIRILDGELTWPINLNTHTAEAAPEFGIGDIDGDGDPDLAVAHPNRVRVFINDGAGGFTLHPIVLSVTGPNDRPYHVELEDLDGDGLPEILCLRLLYMLIVYPNLGGMEFGPRAEYDIPAGGPVGGGLTPRMALGDVDADGDKDVAVATSSGLWCALFRNRGDGTFWPRESYTTGDWPWIPALHDLNGDGRADLGMANSRHVDDALHLALTNAAGRPVSYELTRTPAIAETRICAVAEDLDGDGDADLLFATPNPGFPLDVRFMTNDGSGSFSLAGGHSLGPPPEVSASAVAAADMNGDGLADLVLSDVREDNGWILPGKIWVVLNRGGMTFEALPAYDLDGFIPYDIAPGDLDGDGDTDAAVWTGGVYPGDPMALVQRRVLILLNDGSGALHPHAHHLLGELPPRNWGSLTLADLNLDGAPDLIACYQNIVEVPGSGEVHIFLNDGAAGFTRTQIFAVSGAQRISAGDVNGDGFPDVAVGAAGPIFAAPRVTNLSLFRNDGSGTLIPAGTTEYPEFEIHGADVTGDGLMDIIGHHRSSVIVAVSRGDMTFAAAAYTAGFGVFTTALADFDADGRIDVVAQHWSGPAFALLRNRSCRALPCYANCDGSAAAPALNVADFTCFLRMFATGDAYANCDESTEQPILRVPDFVCFLQKFAAGCP